MEKFPVAEHAWKIEGNSRVSHEDCESLQPFFAFAARTLAQRFFCAAMMLALPAADIFPFFLPALDLPTFTFPPLTLAQRSFCAREIAARAALENLGLVRFRSNPTKSSILSPTDIAARGRLAPKIEAISPLSSSMRSLKCRARFNCPMVGMVMNELNRGQGLESRRLLRSCRRVRDGRDDGETKN